MDKILFVKSVGWDFIKKNVNKELNKVNYTLDKTELE